MSFSYAQKRELINILSDEDNWKQSLEDNRESRFPHRIEIDRRDIQRFTKLVLAKDIGLEPDIKIIKTAMQESFWQLLERTKNPINNNDLNKELDSTDFDGGEIDTPKNFFMQLTDNGFAVMLSHDDYNLVREHRKLLEHATSSNARPIDLTSQKTIDETDLQLFIDAGNSIDGIQSEWLVSVFFSSNNNHIVHKAKQLLTTALNARQSSTAFCFNENTGLIAIRSESLQSLENSRKTKISIDMATMEAPSSQLN